MQSYICWSAEVGGHTVLSTNTGPHSLLVSSAKGGTDIHLILSTKAEATL